ncbi:MAG: hypothetical protein Q9P01_04370 [Anaerolineae bacterium]|nr:hypothetical protein [Anaerolineae bacterium]
MTISVVHDQKSFYVGAQGIAPEKHKPNHQELNWSSIKVTFGKFLQNA